MTWQLFTFISVIALSISVVLQRILIYRDKIDPYAYAILFQAIVGVLLTAFALGYGFKLPNIETMLIPAVVSIVLFGAGHIIYAQTLQKVEASVFSILFATQAIWLMLLGIILLKETMSFIQAIGVLLIFVSVGLLAKNYKLVFVNKGVRLGLLVGLMFGVAIYAWSYVGRYTDAISWAAISFVATSLVSLLIRPNSLRQMKPLLQPDVLLKLVVLAVFYSIGSLTMLYAYKYGSFSIVSPLRQASVIVTIALALVFLSIERNRLDIKLLAAIICTIGVVLIVV